MKSPIFDVKKGLKYSLLKRYKITIKVIEKKVDIQINILV